MTRSWTPLILFLTMVALLFIAFLIFYPASEEVESPPERITTTIPVRHFYSNGTHTYVGEISTPTPCYSVSGEAIVTKSDPETALVKIEMTDETTKNSACIQEISEKKFKVAFEARENVLVRSFLNGTPVLFLVSEAKSLEELK